MTELYAPQLDTTDLLESALLDLQIFRLRRVGRRHLSLYSLWLEWIKE